VRLVADRAARRALGKSRRLVLGIAAGSVVALGAVAAVVIVLVTHSQAHANETTTSTPRTRAGAPDTPSAQPSASAPLADYTYLLLKTSDVGSDATTLGPPIQNPGGVPGAALTFTNADRTRRLDDLVVVFADPTAAVEAAKRRASDFGGYVTGAPQPFEVGTNGLIAVGLSPDNSKAVTYVTFAEGKVGVDLEFDSAPNDPAPQDVVLDSARKQDANVKSRMPS
jgi:hypothetical protein